jgi:hypothetical protein
MILEDRKGFSKIVEVYAYQPVYEISLIPALQVIRDKESIIAGDAPELKTIKFFPSNEPTKHNGIECCTYKEM